MATSKSTVLGIRLDHDRRAWIEAEAVRRGVSVRGLIEGMIDGARVDETVGTPTGDVMGSESAHAPAVADRSEDGFGGAPYPQESPPLAADASVNTTSSLHTGTSSPVDSTSSAPFASSPWPDLGSVTALPGDLIRGAFSLTTGLIKTGERCARSRVEHCPLTRLWSNRSV